MNNAENIRAYTITEDGRAEIDMTTVNYKSRQTEKAARDAIREQAKKETDATLHDVVELCRGTQLALIARQELIRRNKARARRELKALRETCAA